MIVSSTRLRCARLLRGHSTRPWHVIDGLRLGAVGQRQCRPERGVVTTARPSAERLQSIPARPRLLKLARGGGGLWPTRGVVSHGGPPAVARRRPTAIFVRGANARAEPVRRGESRPSRWSSSAAGVRTSRGGDDTSNNKTLPETIRNDAPSWTSTTGIPPASTAGMPPPRAP